MNRNIFLITIMASILFFGSCQKYQPLVVTNEESTSSNPTITNTLIPPPQITKTALQVFPTVAITPTLTPSERLLSGPLKERGRIELDTKLSLGNIKVNKNHLFVNLNYDEIIIFDITDISTPEELTKIEIYDDPYDSPLYTSDWDIDDQYLYMYSILYWNDKPATYLNPGTFKGVIRIYDLTLKKSIKIIGSYEYTLDDCQMPDKTRIIATDNRLYIYDKCLNFGTGMKSFFHIFDISNAAQPKLLSNIDILKYAPGELITASGNLAIFDSESGTGQYDPITIDMTNPEYIDVLESPVIYNYMHLHQIYLNDDLLSLIDSNHLESYDISDFDNPLEINTFFVDVDVYLEEAVVTHNYTCIEAQDGTSLYIFDNKIKGHGKPIASLNLHYPKPSQVPWTNVWTM